MNSHFDAEIASLAQRRHGLITLALVRDVAQSPRVDWLVERRLAQGVWRSAERGVYAIAGSPDTWRQRLLAATLASGPAAVGGRRSAAAVYGIPGFPERPVDIVALRPVQTKPRHGTVFQTKSLPDSHRTTIDAIPVTTVARTVFDLASQLPMGRVARALDHSLAHGLAPVERFWDVFFDLAKRGRTGTRVMRALLQERADHYVAAASELERRFHELVREHSLPEPRGQVDLGDDDGWIGRVDFLFPGNVVVETDGRRYHSALLDHDSDAERDARLRASGRRVMRFTWRDIVERPDTCVAAIRDQLEGQAA